MKLIGIMGNAGSGKTTFSNYLDSKDNIGVIHVDELVGRVKKKYFKPFLQPKENNSTENTKANPKVKVGAKNFFYKNRLLFRLLMLLRSKMVERELHSRIAAFKSDGKSAVVVDDWALPYHKKLSSKFYHVYHLNRKYVSRREGLKQRDALTIEEMKISDIPYALGFIKAPQSNVSTIENNGTLEDLYQAAEEEYKKLELQTFDEKYSLRGKVDFRSVVSHLNKTNSKGEYNQVK